MNDLYIVNSLSSGSHRPGIRHLYEGRKNYCNLKLAKLFDRLTGMINYLLRERAAGQKEQVMRNNTVKKADKVNYDDCKLAA